MRQDEHIAIAAGMLALVGWVLMLGQPGLRPALGLIVGLAGWAVLDAAAEPLTPGVAMARAQRGWAAAAEGLASRLSGDGARQRTYDESLAVIRARYPLPPLAGTADIYSTGQAILIAHGLDWAPRPVLQSYSAYSPPLAQDDARHLESGSAPQNVLFSVEPIDGRLAALEDGLSWPALLAGYEAVELRGTTAILRRREAGVETAPVGAPLASGAYALGEEIPLPPGHAALWARIGLEPTPLGRAVAAVFKPPLLSIVFRFPDGREERRRYLSRVGEAGFLISPVVADTAQFLALALPGAGLNAGRTPSSFRIEGTSGTRLLWQHALTLDLSAFSVPPRPGVRRLLLTPLSKVEAAARPAAEIPGGARCNLDAADGRPMDRVMPLRFGTAMSVAGWGFIAAKGGAAGDGIAPDAIQVTLTAPDGTAYAAPARIARRPDVGAYVHQPALADVGFDARIDLQGLSGPFRLGLALASRGKLWACSFPQPVEIGP